MKVFTIKSIIWQYLANIVQFASFYSNVLLANYLTPTGFTFYSQVMVVYSYIVTFISCGLNEFIFRFFKKDLNKNLPVIANAIVLQVVYAIVVTIVLILNDVFQVITNEIFSKVMYLIPFIFMLPFTVLTPLYIQHDAGSRIAKAQIITNLTINSIKIILILLNCDIIHFVILYGFEISLMSILLWRLLPARLQVFQNYDYKLLKQLLKVSLVYLLVAMITVIGSKLDQVYAKEILGPNDAGSYFAALRLTEVLFFIPLIFGQSLNKYITARNEKSYFFVYMIGSVVLCTLFYMSSRSIFSFLYSDDYNELYIKNFTVHLLAFCFLIHAKQLAVRKGEFNAVLLGSALATSVNFIMLFVGVYDNSNLFLAPAIFSTSYTITVYFFIASRRSDSVK